MLISMLIAGCASDIGSHLENDHKAQAADTPKKFKASDFEFLLQRDVSNYQIDTHLAELGYAPRYKGTYTTNDKDGNSKPSSWVSIVSLGGDSKQVSFKTAHKEDFDLIRAEVDSLGYVQNLENQTAFYVKLIGPDFEFEFHRPERGVNTALNNYYEILSLPVKRKGTAAEK
jgi:hypothetical protein